MKISLRLNNNCWYNFILPSPLFWFVALLVKVQILHIESPYSFSDLHWKSFEWKGSVKLLFFCAQLFSQLSSGWDHLWARCLHERFSYLNKISIIKTECIVFHWHWLPFFFYGRNSGESLIVPTNWWNGISSILSHLSLYHLISVMVISFSHRPIFQNSKTWWLRWSKIWILYLSLNLIWSRMYGMILL